jgi:hypothetical protein
MRHLVVVLVAFAVTTGRANARAADFTARPSWHAAEATQ